MNLNKWLYNKNVRLYLISVNIRMTFYTFINRKNKAIAIVTEHFKW